MKRRFIHLATALEFAGLAGCASNSLLEENVAESVAEGVAEGVVVVPLADDAESMRAFERLRDALRARNPGYDVRWFPDVAGIDASDDPRVLFVQRGTANATVTGDLANTSAIGPGDAILLRPLERLACDAPASFLAFTVVEPLPIDVPSVLRPDFDPRIDDQQGGCATEDKPYRRLLLTWKPENGPYVYHGLNAHRVRIVDSFTHYHPVAGGFDEMYLVQGPRAGARLFTGAALDRIETPESVTKDEASRLLVSHELATEELIFIPRGVVHRGTGGAIVSVITIPGFKPGAEIGVDHHLRAIDERLGGSVVPFHVEGSKTAVVR